MTEKDMARLETLRKEREELYQEHKADFDFVNLIGQKAVLKVKGILVVSIVAFALLIGVTWLLHVLMPDLGPMWMWLTVGLPAVAAVAYTIVVLHRHEKYSDYHRQLVADMGSVSMQLFEYDRAIEALEERAAEEAADAE